MSLSEAGSDADSQDSATDAYPPCHTAPEADPSPICDGGGVVDERVGEGAKRKRKEVLDLEKQNAKQVPDPDRGLSRKGRRRRAAGLR
jgi:hypothetical protein